LRRKLNHDHEIKPVWVELPSRSSSPPGAAGKDILEGETRFEILSWNVNGISHLLPQTQPNIKSSFRKTLKEEAPELGSEDEQESVGGEAPLTKFLRRHKSPQMVCLQEVKISSKNGGVGNAVERAANAGGGPGYKAWFELPSDRFNATAWGGKLYGVCTLVRDDVMQECARMETRGVDWDDEGRVLVTEPEFGGNSEKERGKKNKLAVINGYWPNER
jgi:exonuclease III